MIRRVPDLPVAGLVALAMLVTVAIATEEDSVDPFPLGYVVALGVAALVPLRRRSPLGVLAATMLVLLVYYSARFPAFSPAIPLAAATYFAALGGRAVAAGAAVAAFNAFAFLFQVVEPGRRTLAEVGQTLIADVALLGCVLLLGVTVRNRRLLDQEAGARLAQAEADRVREAQLTVQEERLRIARELHDVMAHTVSALSVQAAVAEDALDDEPDAARAALRTIREQSRHAVGEVRAAVGLLREDPAPPPGLAALEDLLATARDAGLAVGLEADGAASGLPEVVDRAAYRIVQESLTNVIRHAHATRADVRISRAAAAIAVEVRDDGRGGAPDGQGHGLTGMAERAAAVGGTFEAGARPEGGFRVKAVLPL